MNNLTTKILGTIFISLFLFSCNKVDLEDIPSTIVLQDDNYEINQGESIEIDFLSNDILEGEELLISVLDNTLEGKLTPIENSTKYNYKANFEFSGIESFNYQVCSNGDCKNGLVSINVIALPDSCMPEAIDDHYSAKDGGFTTSINNIIDNDINLCNEWNKSSFKITKQPSAGSLNFTNNEITFFAFNNEWRKDQFTYEICSENGNCVIAVVNITNGDAIIESLF